MLKVSESQKPQEEVFAKVTLPNGLHAVVLEGYGRHFYGAMKSAKGDNTQLGKWLIVELVKIDGKSVSEKDVENLHMRDISYLSEVIGTMMSNDIPGL